jgi:hypothetical protein
MPDAGYRIPDARYQNPASGIRHPASGIRYLASGIQHPQATPFSPAPDKPPLLSPLNHVISPHACSFNEPRRPRLSAGLQPIRAARAAR